MLALAAPSGGTAQVVPVPEPALSISTPADARTHGLGSLRQALKEDGSVPLPTNLGDFVRDREAAIRLGKALFWDMKLGSDGVQSCATCHFAAGTDNRSRNQLNPDLLRVKDQRDGDIKGYGDAPGAPDTQFNLPGAGADRSLTAADFPFVKNIESVVHNADGSIGPGPGNTNDTAASMGVFFTLFGGTKQGATEDKGSRLKDPVFNVNGVTTRRVEPRNTPTVINAVFNFSNFWDGRANHVFNGVNPFGLQDPTAGVFVLQKDGTVAIEKVALENASLASQAVGPPLSHFEMSFGNPDADNARSYPELARKLIRGNPVPLERQLVDPKDSVLGSVTAHPKPGLTVSYRKLIQQAFQPKLWDWKGQLKLTKTKLARNTTALAPSVSAEFTAEAPTSAGEPVITKEGNYSQMEANFALFVGVSIMLYEATLVSDQTPFDAWMESGTLNPRFTSDALAGLNLFVGKAHCIACHSGPELTNATVRRARSDGKNAIEPMLGFEGPVLYDNGFYNIGITPTTDDLGRGGLDLNGRPLAFSRQALFQRELGVQMPFPVTGNSTISATTENGDNVCNDVNGNGFCDPSEPLSPGWKRASVDGAFKTPGLRNQELMAPYMHNGGLATLRQVVEFYNRGGNFCRTNHADIHRDIAPRDMSAQELDQLVSFLLSLTDQRVALEQAPFDHPELFLPTSGAAEGSQNTQGLLRLPQVGSSGLDPKLQQAPFLGLSPRDAGFSPAGTCSKDE